VNYGHVFGRYQLGYAWALIEPVATVLILVVVFSALGKHRYHDIDCLVPDWPL